MSAKSSISLRLCLALLLCGVPITLVAYQEETPKTPEQEVQIQREALQISSPQAYRAHLHLDPAKSLVLTAPVDGVIRIVNLKLGQKTAKEAEAFRLDDSRAALLLKAAKARFLVAQLASKKDPGESSAAALEAAQAELDLAQLDLDRLVIHAPFVGEVHKVNVLEGQFVRAGEPLGIIADVSKLQVEVPVERATAKQGGDVDLKIGENSVKAKIDAVLPLNARFETLRDLSDNLVSVAVSLDNAAGKYAAGQTVHCEVIPVAPVTSVATSSVKNQKDGKFRVQILRNNVVRDITIRVLSKIGTEKVFVSGNFQEGDEVITASTVELADGTPLRAILGEPPAAAGPSPAVGTSISAPRPGTPKTAPAKPAAGGF